MWTAWVIARSKGAHETLCLPLNISYPLPVVYGLMSFGEKMVIYHAKFSKEMLIPIWTHSYTHTQMENTHSLHFPYIHSFFFFSSSPRCVAKAARHFQGEYFSLREKQAEVRAGIRGQWYVCKETFPLFTSLVIPGILISTERTGKGEMTGALWLHVSGRWGKLCMHWC